MASSSSTPTSGTSNAKLKKKIKCYLCECKRCYMSYPIGPKQFLSRQTPHNHGKLYGKMEHGIPSSHSVRSELASRSDPAG